VFISKDKYYRLLDCKEINAELEKEIKRLEHMLNTKERTCKIGPWCEKCGHWVKDDSKIISNFSNEYTSEDAYWGATLPEKIGGEVGYCNKRVHNLCPDFILNK
jgi:hypothetical protein